MIYILGNSKVSFSSSEKYDFMFVESVVSVNCKFDQLGVRISDILSNFIGRMLKSIEDEYIEDQDVDETKKKNSERKILSKEWFRINEKQVNLYKKIAYIFDSRINYHFTTSIGLYAGSDISFIYINTLYWF